MREEFGALLAAYVDETRAAAVAAGGELGTKLTEWGVEVEYLAGHVLRGNITPDEALMSGRAYADAGILGTLTLARQERQEQIRRSVELGLKVLKVAVAVAAG